MAAKKRTKKAGVRKVELMAVPEDSIAMFDVGKEQMAVVRLDVLQGQLEKAIDAVQKALARAEHLGAYALTAIDLSFGLEMGFVVVGVKGGITLRYTRPIGTAES